ncbi:nuclear transport factor 2 family protein [Pollutibacter soli]|uniref:nuclear transport factor 2 family protein n=1 Tax=Pollutibacter soli TaxID=3034157 RepID=UPI00301386F7
MKKVLIFLFSVMLTMQVSAQADLAAVNAATESLRKGLMEKNKTLLDHITHPSLSYGHSSGLIEDKATFINALITGPVSFAAIDISGQTVKIEGDVAIVRHLWTAKLMDNGNPRDLKLSVILVWKKDKKDWKLLARQAVKM